MRGNLRFPLFRLAHVTVDIILCLLVYLVVYLLRFEGHIPQVELQAFWIGLPVLVGVRLFSNYLMGLYSHIWKYVGLREMFSIIQAVALGSFLFVLITYLMGITGFPRSIFVFEAAFYLLAIGGVRYSRRFSSEVSLVTPKYPQARALIVGAGDAGTMVANDMLRKRDKGFVPVGFIDDNPDKWRARIHNLRVFGGRERLAEVVQLREIDTIILAMPSVSRRVIREYLELCRPLNLNLRIVPATHQILSGEVQIEQLRQIQIDDLLGRDPVRIHDAPVRNALQGQRVLVTGAGGSIGSELCRQILDYGPEVLYVLGHGENSIYNILGELGREQITPIIADIRDPIQLRRVFQELRPHQVFHAAAHKHVPLMELHPREAFLNNVLGSFCVLSTALEQGVDKAVLISTDKAAEPSSVMGLSKYFAELVCHYLAREQEHAGKLSVVRFGNVIGSRGSVIPLFSRQIEHGGPMTVTHPEMSRYFMTIPEAVQLVLQASVLEQEVRTFILDMGEPIRILELARNMIQLMGHSPEEIEIQYTGMRPGEKIHETLVWNDENLLKTECPQILAAQAPFERILFHLELLEELLSLVDGAAEEFERFYGERLLPQFPQMQSVSASALPDVTAGSGKIEKT